MIEQTIIQTALSLIETFDGTKNKFKAWAESVQNATQISSQATLHIAFSKITGSPLSSKNRSKAKSQNLTWMDLKRVLSMQFSTIHCLAGTRSGRAP